MNPLKLNRLRAPLLAALLPLALAACSSAPNSADVEQALKNGMQKAMDEAKAQDKNAGALIANIMSQVKFKKVNVLKCTEAPSDKGYDCSVEITATTPMAGEQTSTKQLHLVKGKDGWEIGQ